MKSTRRDFLKSIIGAGVLGTIPGHLSTAQQSQITPSQLDNVAAKNKYNVRAITKGPKHHFFGYYGICPWNKSQTHLLTLETDFQDHMPNTSEKAAIGLINVKNGKFKKITETAAWNFQQGAMLHWDPLNPDSEIFYNDRTGNQIVSKILNIQNGHTKELPRPINALSHDGKYALSLTYGRLGRLRKVVGYSGMRDPNIHEPYPDNDGVFLTDIQTGKSKLIVSIAQVNTVLKNRGLDLKGAHMWFNHVVFNKSDTRFLFLARVWRPEHLPHLRDLTTGMFTVNIDGSNLIETIPFEYGVSHFDWRNDQEIIATFQDIEDNNQFKHFIFKDGSGQFRLLGNGELNFDGHCTFAPNQRWIATDKKIKNNNTFRQHLYIYDMAKNQLKRIVNFDMKEKQNINGNLRCDFHPRWNHSGDAICFDAIDQKDGTRQLHVVNLKELN